MNQTLKHMPGALFVVVAFAACAWAAAGPVAGLITAVTVSALLVFQVGERTRQLRPARMPGSQRQGLERRQIDP